MSITDERLKQIAEIEDKIKEKIAWIKEKKDELKQTLAIAQTIPDEYADIMSQSASNSTGNRGMGATLDINSSAARNKEIVAKLDEAVEQGEKELEELKKEKEALEEFAQGS